jgi:uncharacterized lipoprotein YajG
MKKLLSIFAVVIMLAACSAPKEEVMPEAPAATEESAVEETPAVDTTEDSEGEAEETPASQE